MSIAPSQFTPTRVGSLPSEGPISGRTMVPELLRRHPSVRPVLDRYGLEGCGGEEGPAESLSFFARMHGVPEPRLLEEIHAALAPQASPRRAAAASASDPSSKLADSLYRLFFLGAIGVTLSAGATWGAILLWQIAIAHHFTGISLHAINAHGSAQIFGWVGLFVMGFAYQAFPRFWQTKLAWPRAGAVVFLLTILGIAMNTIGVAVSGAWPAGVNVAVAGSTLHVFAGVLFTAQLLATFRTGKARLEPYVAFIFAAFFWYIAMSVLNAWHTWTTLTAPDMANLLYHVATYQAPLRDMQIHGVFLAIILGVSIKVFPVIYGLPRTSQRRAWWALGLLSAAVMGEVTLFVAYRWSNNHVLAAFLMIPWLMIAIACAMIALPWKLWRKTPVTDRSSKFVRAAYGWLGLSLAMLLMLPGYLHAVNVPFSHAYYGAIRHAITVGFVSLMIVGVGGRVIPILNGLDPRRLPGLWGIFILLNVGCLLRVSMQVLTDRYAWAFAVIGFSGVLEVIGLTWWSISMVRILLGWAKQRDAAVSTSQPPSRIEHYHRISDILTWYPSLAPVLVARGFTPLTNPVMRRTLARGVTLAEAAAIRGMDSQELVGELNAAVAR